MLMAASFVRRPIIFELRACEHPPHTPMQEFKIYLPTTTNDGTPVDGGEIQRIKDDLVKAFGGYTHLNHRSEGAWGWAA